MKIMQSERHFAWTLGVPIDRLRKIADTPTENYHEFSRWKDASKTQSRTIRNPKNELKRIQRLIKDRIFGDDVFGPEVQGGISGRSPKTNAEKHLGAHVLATMDIKKFFDNVDHKMVFRTLREFGYGTEVARLITQLTTRKGLLPQGAPTSGVMANLVLTRSVDTPTRWQAQTMNMVFTRFVDDIGLSGRSPTSLVGDIARRLSSQGLTIHRGSKLRIRTRAVPQKITGLNINSGRPTVPREYRDNNIRSAIHGLTAVTDPVKRTALERSISGRISYVEQFQPTVARKLRKLLRRAGELKG